MNFKAVPMDHVSDNDEIITNKNNNNSSDNNKFLSFKDIPIIQWGNKEVVEWIESLDNSYSINIVGRRANNNNHSDNYNFCCCCKSLSSSSCNLIRNFKDIAKYFKFHDIYGIDLISLEWKDIEIMFFENDYFQSLSSPSLTFENKDNIKEDKFSGCNNDDIYNNEDCINNCCKEKCLNILQQFYFIIDSLV